MIRTRKSRASPRVGDNNKEKIKGGMFEVESTGIGSHWRAVHVTGNILQSNRSLVRLFIKWENEKVGLESSV